MPYRRCGINANGYGQGSCLLFELDNPVNAAFPCVMFRIFSPTDPAGDLFQILEPRCPGIVITAGFEHQPFSGIPGIDRHTNFKHGVVRQGQHVLTGGHKLVVFKGDAFHTPFKGGCDLAALEIDLSNGQAGPGRGEAALGLFNLDGIEGDNEGHLSGGIRGRVIGLLGLVHPRLGHDLVGLIQFSNPIVFCLSQLAVSFNGLLPIAIESILFFQALNRGFHLGDRGSRFHERCLVIMVVDFKKRLSFGDDLTHFKPGVNTHDSSGNFG